ncbi:hypothetical protein WNY51_17320 [Pseudocolwellia sp. AS88]|uniref:hypothetical protein n=1 Tax=Pseudocolwellia sp. AS88 TaxID=3063958 RepID=UPI0026E99AE0|nr:hypothetical protein [Pseudocolwellia sp. AS88]MDO7085359.1 hypothetical protein [Pseudocolwellia sp. AS88]
MFEEKYIMTGIVSMLLIAAWQRPEVFKKHISNKVMAISGFILMVLIVWGVATKEAIKSIPPELSEATIKSVTLSIENNYAPTTWSIFSFVLFFGSFFLDWIADISLEYEKGKTNKPL